MKTSSRIEVNANIANAARDHLASIIHDIGNAGVQHSPGGLTAVKGAIKGLTATAKSPRHVLSLTATQTENLKFWLGIHEESGDPMRDPRLSRLYSALVAS